MHNYEDFQFFMPKKNLFSCDTRILDVDVSKPGGFSFKKFGQCFDYIHRAIINAFPFNLSIH